MSEVKITAARQKQSENDKQSLLDKLKGKRPRRKTIAIDVSGEEVQMTFEAISAHELDKLQTKHKPTTEQRARGFAFNPNTFAPALVAACSVEPKLSLDDAREIWESEFWSTGELNQLFDTCSNLCMEGMQVPFTKSD